MRWLYSWRLAAWIVLFGLTPVGSTAAEGNVAARSPELIVQDTRERSPHTVSFGPKGRRIAAGVDRTTVVWDARTGYVTRRFPEGSNVGPFFSPDDGKLLIKSYDSDTSRATLWDVVTGRKLHTFRNNDEPVRELAYSPCGRYVAVAYEDHHVLIFDAESGKPRHTLSGHQDRVRCLAFWPDGSKLLSGGEDGLVRQWDVATGKQVKLFSLGVYVESVAVDPKGERIAAGSTGGYSPSGKVILFSAATGKPLHTLQVHAKQVWFAAAGGKVAARDQSDVFVWDAVTGKKLPQLARPGNGIHVAYAPDGQQLRIAGDGDGATIWSLDGETPWPTFRAQTDGSHAWDFSPDGKLLLCGAGDGVAVLWNVSKARKLRTFEGFGGGSFSPDGRLFVTASRLTAVLRRVPSGDVVHTLTIRKGGILTLRFSRDSRWLVAACCDWYDGDKGQCVFWDVKTGRRVRTLFDEDQPAAIIAELTPDGKRLLAGHTPGEGGSQPYEISLWDMATLQRLRVFRENRLGFLGARLDPSGKQIIATTEFGPTVFWDIDTGRLLRTFPGEGPVLSPDGRKLMTMVARDRAVLWDVAQRRKLRTFAVKYETYGWCSVVVFHPDGKRFAYGTPNGVHLLDLDSGAEIARLMTFGEGREWLITTPGRYYTGSEEGRRRVAWREGEKVFPEQRHAEEFHRPETVVQVLGGQSPLEKATAVEQPPDPKTELPVEPDATVPVPHPIVRETGEPALNTIALSADGRRLVAGAEDGSVVLWDMTTGRILRTFAGTELSMILAISPDGRLVATSGPAFQSVRLWRTDTGERIRTLEGPAHRVCSIDFSPDGRRVLTVFANRPIYRKKVELQSRVILWDTSDGRQIKDLLADHPRRIRSTTLSPDGRLMAACFRIDKIGDGPWETVALFDVKTGEKVRGLNSLQPYLRSAKFSRDGRRLMVIESGKTVLWDVASGERLWDFRERQGIAGSDVTFDGKRAVTTSMGGGGTFLWNTATGKESQKLERPFPGHERLSGRSPTFTPDGRRIIAATRPGTLAIWDAATGKLLARLHSRNGHRDWLVTTPQGYFDCTPEGRNLLTWQIGDDRLPIEAYESQYHRPELVARVLRGLPVDGTMAAKGAGEQQALPGSGIKH